MTQTPVPAGSGNLPVSDAQMQQWSATGLEDFGVSDAVLPRLKILQKEGLWQDNLSQVKRPILRFIPLGMVKQRVLFHNNVEDGDVPMCKSADFNTGYPNPDAPRNKSFPWQLSGFDPQNFAPDAEGNVKLPCNGCQLKEWGTHPASDNPYCSEQWTIPLYFDGSQDGSGEWVPAILSLQKSSIKPIRSFFTSFFQQNKPPFLVIAQGSLKVYTRGTVTYSVPTFTTEQESPRERWQEFADQFQDMRKFLTRPPVREDAGEGAQQSDNSYGQPQQSQPVPVQVQPAPQDPWAASPPPAVSQDPWAQPAPAQPAQPAPAQPAPPAPQPVAPQPVAQPAPPAPQPVAQPAPPAPQPVAQPAPPAPQPVAPSPVAQPAVEQQPEPTPPAPAAQPAPPSGQGLPF